VKKVFVLLGVALIALLAWLAAGPNPVVNRPPAGVAQAIEASPPIGSPVTTTARGRSEPGPPPVSGEHVVPADVIAPIATAAAATPPTGDVPLMLNDDALRPLIVPVAGIARTAMRDMFNDVRGNRRHEAIDILAPRGTPVIAADDGVVKKLFTSVPGGLTVYEFDPNQRFCYYYAHLDGYASGLHEGQQLHRGEILGYVGTTGNAPKNTPHLHFALIRLDPERRWWKGTYVDPYPLLAGRQTP
jgi:murein DD-endopeptidase MepM/ murein hydrolase activator NlpD